MVSKQTRESEKATRGWNRKAKTLRSASPASVLRALRRGWRSPSLRSNGRGHPAPAQLPRRPPNPPTCHQHEHSELFTTTLTVGERGSARTNRSTAIFLMAAISWTPVNEFENGTCWLHCDSDRFKNKSVRNFLRRFN